MQIIAKPLSIASENKKGGLCSRSIDKSMTKILVIIGVATRVLRIFLNMSFSNYYTINLSVYKECE